MNFNDPYYRKYPAVVAHFAGWLSARSARSAYLPRPMR
jgi:hypothetical protein